MAIEVLIHTDFCANSRLRCFLGYKIKILSLVLVMVECNRLHKVTTLPVVVVMLTFAVNIINDRCWAR